MKISELTYSQQTISLDKENQLVRGNPDIYIFHDDKKDIALYIGESHDAIGRISEHIYGGNWCCQSLYQFLRWHTTKGYIFYVTFLNSMEIAKNLEYIQFIRSFKPEQSDDEFYLFHGNDVRLRAESHLLDTVGSVFNDHKNTNARRLPDKYKDYQDFENKKIKMAVSRIQVPQIQFNEDSEVAE